jgi:thiol-disulfide isomerase/thioredoxin
MMKFVVMQAGMWVMTAAALVFALGGSAAAQDSWQEVVDQSAQETEDNPAWEQYAFSLESLSDDSEVSFVELAREGKPFVLIFWLMDCPLCHLQMPLVQQLQETVDRHSLDLRVVAVNLDHSGKEAKEFYEEKGMTFDLLHDPRARYTDEAFHISDLGCPLVYVFDDKGELVDYLTGYRAQLQKTVFKLLDISVPDEAHVK